MVLGKYILMLLLAFTVGTCTVTSKEGGWSSSTEAEDLYTTTEQLTTKVDVREETVLEKPRAPAKLAAGVSAGTVGLLVVVLAVAAICYMKHRRNQRSKSHSGIEEINLDRVYYSNVTENGKPKAASAGSPSPAHEWVPTADNNEYLVLCRDANQIYEEPDNSRRMGATTTPVCPPSTVPDPQARAENSYYSSIADSKEDTTYQAVTDPPPQEHTYSQMLPQTYEQLDNSQPYEHTYEKPTAVSSHYMNYNSRNDKHFHQE